MESSIVLKHLNTLMFAWRYGRMDARLIVISLPPLQNLSVRGYLGSAQ